MRDITQLHPKLQEKIYELIDVCQQNNIIIGISECLRTRAEQNALYAQGRTIPGNIVTNCKGDTYSSMHQWGVAFDFFLKMDVDGDGKISDDEYNDSTGLFSKVGSLGKQIGLEWGGDWKSIKDKPHFQLPDWGSTASKLKKEYGTPEMFFKTWTTAKTTTINDEEVAKSSSEGAGLADVTAKSGLKVRSTPSASNNRNQVGSIPYKATCELIEVDSATEGGLIWARVSYKGIYGYAAQKYLNIRQYPATTRTSDTATVSPSAISYSKNVVDPATSNNSSLAGTYKTTANLNIRAGAGTSRDVLNTIPKGEEVTCYGLYTPVGGTKWYLVEFGKYIGYCSSKYLEKVA